MTLPVWPAGVPVRPIEGSFQVAETAPAPLTTDMNAGTTRSRRKYTLRVAKLGFSLFLTNAEAALLQTFHETTLGDGAARFTLSLPWRGAFVTRVAKFAAPPSYLPAGGRQKIGVALLVEAL